LLADLSAQVPGVIFQMLRDVQGRFSFRYVSERVSDTLELAAGTTKAHPKSILRRLRRVDVLPLMRAIRQSAQDRTALRHTCQVDLPRAAAGMCRSMPPPRRPTAVVCCGTVS